LGLGVWGEKFSFCNSLLKSHNREGSKVKNLEIGNRFWRFWFPEEVAMSMGGSGGGGKGECSPMEGVNLYISSYPVTQRCGVHPLQGMHEWSIAIWDLCRHKEENIPFVEQINAKVESEKCQKQYLTIREGPYACPYGGWLSKNSEGIATWD